MMSALVFLGIGVIVVAFGAWQIAGAASDQRNTVRR